MDASFTRRESNEISRFWLYPRVQIEKSERSKRDIVASRENAIDYGNIGFPLGTRQSKLTLKAPITTAADDIHKYFFHCFSEKIRFDVSSEFK